MDRKIMQGLVVGQRIIICVHLGELRKYFDEYDFGLKNYLPDEGLSLTSSMRHRKTNWIMSSGTCLEWTLTPITKLSSSSLYFCYYLGTIHPQPRSRSPHATDQGKG